MPRIGSITALLLVASCAQKGDQPTAAENRAREEITAKPPTREIPRLQGEWKLTKVDGRPLEARSTLLVTFGNGMARIASGCTHRAWIFTQQRNIVKFAPEPDHSSNCEVVPSNKQQAAFNALDRATMAIFDNHGREASLSGDGGNVTLKRR
jgi:hypothetical protein